MDDKKLAKGMRKFFTGTVALVLLFGILYWKYQHDITTPVDENDTTQHSFQIKKGENAANIAENLDEEGLIQSENSFEWYVKLNDKDEELISGRFLLDKTMDTEEIVNKLSDPAQAEAVITIQEGLTISDIDDKLADLELIEDGEFEEEVRTFTGWEYYDFLDQETLSTLDLPLEGYLYPDTYFLDSETFEAHDLIYLALDNFERKTIDLIPQIQKHTVHEIVTIASIIENEVFGSEDRKIVSGILWKRLESGWKLDADATILYITEDREITAADIAIDSPYNTRKYAGLPPGPICNPSIDAIEAAMYPTENDYWFYLTTLDTGEVIYAKTNEEQNANRAKYL